MESEPFLLRIYQSDGTIESFALRNAAQASGICQKTEAGRLFAQPRLIVAGDCFKSVFVTGRILRVDFVQNNLKCWEFPGGYADIVELTEEEFRNHAHLDQPELMARREECTPVGDLLVSFLELRMTGGTRFFLMAEFPVKLPAENQSLMRFLLSNVVFHMRLPCGGIGLVNLANLVSYTVYPGVAQVPADTWLAERPAKPK
jgi:hypothetical protein